MKKIIFSIALVFLCSSMAFGQSPVKRQATQKKTEQRHTTAAKGKRTATNKRSAAASGNKRKDSPGNETGIDNEWMYTPYQKWHNGDEAYKNKNYPEAFRWFYSLAKEGNSAAQYKVGVMCQKGLGVPQSYDDAIKWYRKSADQGYGMGLFGLGWMYQKGYGVSQDYLEALRLYRKSASGIPSFPADGIDEMKKNDFYVDYEEVVRYCCKKADQGDAKAQDLLGWLVYYGYDKGLAEKICGYKSHREWYRKSAEQGYIEGQYDLAESLANPVRIDGNIVEAVSWYKKAAAQGCVDAYLRLGEIYYNGRPPRIPQDETEAKKFWEKAAAQGNEVAKNYLEFY